uniref:Interleukin-15 receptor subunit alpha n=1 Tax=Jaculus jaculus TaxID=51337 RepID=A0A8C5K841_JACJA
TTCPPPISVDYADIQVKSYEENSRERYVCNLGFKRKAGTSSLTQCVLNKTTNTAHWTTPNLKCISAHPHGSGRTTVVISTSVIAVLCGMCAVSFLAWYLKSRCTSRSRGLEMDAAEAMPMTARTGGREEDMGTY